jgi:hypothetical protein
MAGRWSDAGRSWCELPAFVARLRAALRSRNEDRMEWGNLNDLPRSYRLRLYLGRFLFGNSTAYERGLRLLLEHLSPEQRREFVSYGYFHVTGGTSGCRYRICRGRQMNVHQLDAYSRRNCIWCFFPAGSLVDGDVMLAQKLALELFEEDALAIANRMAYRYEPTISTPHH